MYSNKVDVDKTTLNSTGLGIVRPRTDDKDGEKVEETNKKSTIWSPTGSVSALDMWCEEI